MTVQALAVMETAREAWSESGSEAGPAGTLSEDTGTEELGDEIVLIAAHLHACRRVYLERVAEFDRRRGWEPGGHNSCADWLAFRTGCDRNTAREHVRVATPEEEEDLLALAEGVPDDDGGYVVRGRLTLEVGALLMRALDAAEDVLSRKEEDYDEEASPRQRRREAARRRGADPGLLAASARWKGRRQVPDDVWYAALDAGFAAVDTAPP